MMWQIKVLTKSSLSKVILSSLNFDGVKSAIELTLADSTKPTDNNPCSFTVVEAVAVIEVISIIPSLLSN